MAPEQAQGYATQLTGLARQLNSFVSSLKAQRQLGSKKSASVRETTVEYMIDISDDLLPLFNDDELEWLQTIPTNL
jgi:hypothetical protein